MYKTDGQPLALIIQRLGPPLPDPDVTDDAAGNTDQCMTHAEACNEKEDNYDDDNYEKSDNYDNADNEQNNNNKNNKKKGQRR